MAGRTVTRAHLNAAAYQTSGLSKGEVSALAELVLAVITNALAKGETFRIASFGTFSTARKAGRIGRNPKTGEAAMISPRTVVVFRPSQILKGRIRAALAEKEPRGQSLPGHRK